MMSFKKSREKLNLGKEGKVDAVYLLKEEIDN